MFHSVAPFFTLLSITILGQSAKETRQVGSANEDGAPNTTSKGTRLLRLLVGIDQQVLREVILMYKNKFLKNWNLNPKSTIQMRNSKLQES